MHASQSSTQGASAMVVPDRAREVRAFRALLPPHSERSCLPVCRASRYTYTLTISPLSPGGVASEVMMHGQGVLSRSITIVYAGSYSMILYLPIVHSIGIRRQPTLPLVPMRTIIEYRDECLSSEYILIEQHW